MPAARRRHSWRPTHRVVLIAGANQSVQSVQVMRADDGFAYTRFQWDNVLLPSLRQSPRGHWVLNGHSDLAAAGHQTAWRIQPLTHAEPGPTSI